MTGALAALMRGLLYDEGALDDVLALVPALVPAEHLALHAAAQKEGLEARLGAGTLADYARDLVAIARTGLERIDPLDAALLEPLAEVAARGRSPARDVLTHFARQPQPERFLERYAL
jgi:glutamate--cysteine ligase